MALLFACMLWLQVRCSTPILLVCIRLHMHVCACVCVCDLFVIVCVALRTSRKGGQRHLHYSCRSLSAGRTYGTGLNSWGSSWGLLCRAQSYLWWWETKQQLWLPVHCCSEKGFMCLQFAPQLFLITPAGRVPVCVNMHKIVENVILVESSDMV